MKFKKKNAQYATFRRGFSGDEADTRCVWFGLDWWLEKYLEPGWNSNEDVGGAAEFFDTHLAPFGCRYPFPREILLEALNDTGGYFPVTIRALPAGTVVHPGVPLFTITAKRRLPSPSSSSASSLLGAGVPSLVTWLESLLTHSWYPSAVATLSRRARDVIESAFERSCCCENGGRGRDSPLVPSRLHDFGLRGATGVEAAVLGGAAHLLSFEGSDTVPACFAAQVGCNAGRPVASSIPATEHSVMTAHGDEDRALAKEIDAYGDGVFACVADSYDYGAFLDRAVPLAKKKLDERRRRRREEEEENGEGKNENGGGKGFFVIRPDSGDPADAVLSGLEAAAKHFGSDVNSKGFRVVRGAGVIQGDGVTLGKIEEILEKVLERGFSAENVAFGMGGGLLQNVNRDTMSFATKLCRVVVAKKGEEGGEEEKEQKPRGSLLVSFDVMKAPTGDRGKASLPGALAVARDPDSGLLTAVPAAALLLAAKKQGGRGEEEEGGGENGGGGGDRDDAFARFRGLDDELELVYDCGPVPGRSKPSFDELRAKVKKQWEQTPKRAADGGGAAVHPALRAWAEEVRQSGGRKESKWR